MHNLKSLYNEHDDINQAFLKPIILEEQLGNIKFQQLLYERRLKTFSFKSLLHNLKIDNIELIQTLNSNNK